MVAKALEVFKGERLMYAYDIGCAFGVTLKNSSLGPEFHRRGCRTCVNALHGYTHNYQCQLGFHPSRITGMGLEDVETCERIFSSSNALASVTRFATPYHRHSLMDIHFQQWDADRYLALGSMLYNNYRQALEVIDQETMEVTAGLEFLGMSVKELGELIDDEIKTFAKMTAEPVADTRRIEYVSLLQELAAAEYVPRLSLNHSSLHVGIN